MVILFTERLVEIPAAIGQNLREGKIAAIGQHLRPLGAVFGQQLGRASGCCVAPQRCKRP